MEKTYVGIDIGKFEITYAYPLSDGSMQEGSFENTPDAIQTFIGMPPAQSHCVMESTGLYHFPLAYGLKDHQIAVSILNPVTSRAFANSFLSITKTDQKDAFMLQRFGQERQLAPTPIAGKEWQAIRHRMGFWQDVQKQLMIVGNKLSELAFHPCADGLTQEMLAQQKELFAEQLKKIEDSIYGQLPEQTGYKEKMESAQSVKGIGPKTAACLLFFTNGFQDFDNVKALAKYIGIAPNVYQSGAYKKKGRICKKGNSFLRKLLYNCARSAYRFNTACKQLYERLRLKGKPHKVAMVAVMHKLLRQVFAVVKNGTVYQDELELKTT